MGYKGIYNGTVITMNEAREIIEDGVVIVNGRHIVAVGGRELLQTYTLETAIDAKEGIIMPGFVNGHCHVSMSVFRGLGEDIPNRLERYLFPLEDQLVDKTLVRVGARLGIAEMIMGGVTTFADMYYYENEVAKASKELGMRAIVGETIIGRIAPDATVPYEGIDYGIDLIKQWLGDELITPALAPHAPYSNDEEHLRKISELSEKYQVPVLIHLAEMKQEMVSFEKGHQSSPVMFLADIGFLNERVIAAHLVYTDLQDIQLLQKLGVGVIHNVAANAKSGRKVAPVPKMLMNKVKVGLGTDGPMSGNTLDIIGLLDQYTKIQKLDALDNAICPSLEAVELGTISGAKALHMDHLIGSLVPGKLADIIIIDTKSPNMQPIYDYYAAIVYSAYPHDVKLTMINGQVVMQSRQLLTANLQEIITDVGRLKEKIIDKMAKMT